MRSLSSSRMMPSRWLKQLDGSPSIHMRLQPRRSGQGPALRNIAGNVIGPATLLCSVRADSPYRRDLRVPRVESDLRDIGVTPRIRALVLTRMWPTHDRPESGTFVKEEV